MAPRKQSQDAITEGIGFEYSLTSTDQPSFKSLNQSTILDKNLAAYVSILRANGVEVLFPTDIMRIEAERKALLEENQRLRQEAQTDGLTGLFNRRYLTNVLDRKLISLNQYAGVAQQKRHNDAEEHALSFLICDIDHFKQVNDTYGHQAGDQVLRQFADVLRYSLRESDIAARYGGEEFALILPNTNIDNAKSIADRIREHVYDTKFIEGQDYRVTVSMGLTQAVYGDDSDMVIKRADTALYDAKHTGRNRLIIYMPDTFEYKSDSLEHMTEPTIVSSR